MDFDRLHKRVKSLHEDADKRAKRALDNEGEKRFDRKIGTMTIDGKIQHLRLKTWSKSANDWSEKKRALEKGGRMKSTQLREKC